MKRHTKSRMMRLALLPLAVAAFALGGCDQRTPAPVTPPATTSPTPTPMPTTPPVSPMSPASAASQ